MSAQSSILAWRIPWKGEPSGLHAVHGVTESWTQLKWRSMHTQFVLWFYIYIYLSWILTPYLHILVLFAHIFSHLIGCLFILFLVFVAVQTLVSLIRSLCLFLLVFILPWETDQRKYWYNKCQWMSCLCSWGFMVLCLTFRFLNCFEFIFCI